MRCNFLGRTGMRVPELGLGLGTQVGTEQFDEKLGRCLEAGANLVDTSDWYSDGKSEELLGEVLVGRRQHVLLSTKAGYRVGPEANAVGNSRHHMLAACDKSLRRLRTDYIDFYQLHAPDLYTHPDETMRVMDDLVSAGKVRYIGCSNYSAWQLMRAQMSARELGLRPFAFQQILYSLLCREAEYELFPAGEDQGIGSMIWGPLAAGFLSGKYQRNQPRPDGSRLSNYPQLPSVPDWDHGFRILDVAQQIAGERGVPVGQVALNWLLCKPWVSTVILGARTMEQLEENLAALAWGLTAGEAQRLDEVSEASPVRYPYWVQRMGSQERNPPLSGFRG